VLPLIRSRRIEFPLGLCREAGTASAAAQRC
jgi:hypothetical protein